MAATAAAFADALLVATPPGVGVPVGDEVQSRLVGAAGTARAVPDGVNLSSARFDRVELERIAAWTETAGDLAALTNPERLRALGPCGSGGPHEGSI